MKKRVKKKAFLIDKISEDSFYENLLLGLTSVLKACQFVTRITLERYAPVTLEEISYWENFNYLILPEDLRNFYLSTNGFSFTYQFQYDWADSDEPNFITGGIEINPLTQLERIVTTETMYLTDGGIKILAPYSKIHVLATLDDNSCVVLAQFNPLRPPRIWLYYKLKNFYLLCEDFITYLRMAVAHLGVPGWQLSVLKASLPEWSSELLQIVAPGIFEQSTLEAKSELNVIDCDVFDSDVDIPLGGLREEEKMTGVGSVSGRKKSAKGKTKK